MIECIVSFAWVRHGYSCITLKLDQCFPTSKQLALVIQGEKSDAMPATIMVCAASQELASYFPCLQQNVSLTSLTCTIPVHAPPFARYLRLDLFDFQRPLPDVAKGPVSEMQHVVHVTVKMVEEHSTPSKVRWGSEDLDDGHPKNHQEIVRNARKMLECSGKITQKKIFP